MIQARIQGEPLAHVWPRMNIPLRRRVVEQLAAILETLHQVSIDDRIPSLSPSWLQSTLPAQITRHAQEAKASPLIDTDLMDEVIRLAEATIVSVPQDRYWGLNHRDLHFDNVLWDGNRIAALLDFESACYAPIDLELDLLLRFCAFPFLYVAEEYEPLAQPKDYRMVPVWLHQFYPRPFQLPGIRKRLCLYSLAYDLKQLLQFPPRDILDIYADEHPLNRIRTIAERTLYIDWQ